jgi:hypothetical protein
MTAMITNAARHAAGSWQQRLCFDQAALYFMKECMDYSSFYLLYDTYNNHVTASASFSITNG